MAQVLRELLSVGIDVGTTTTQVVFSRLALQDVARPGQVPRIKVEARDVLYRSPIHFTPLRTPEDVDVAALKAILEKEYSQAGFTASQIQSGAVIITGEIARTRNADAILQAISNLAGDFVVTVAGPNVEALIAGRGAGAADYSARMFTQVTHIDIGGGTANAAIFRAGDYLGASAMAVGGRMLIIEKGTGLIRHIAPTGRKIVQALGLPLQIGSQASLPVLEAFCAAMADLTADLALGVTSDLGREIYLSAPLQQANDSRVLTFSGGVGTYYYAPISIQTLSDVTVHGDVGPLFAQALHQNARFAHFRMEEPAETLRATVLGAAGQTVTLSGSTIWAERNLLPLRNLPVVHPYLNHGFIPDKVAEALQDGARRWDVEHSGDQIALAIDLPAKMDYPTLQNLVKGIQQYTLARPDPLAPLVLILEHDYAQVLGQTIKASSPQLPVLAIDQVGLDEGDFIDLGLPILGGRVVPLSVKTLIFYR